MMNLDDFISKYVTYRSESMFLDDIKDNNIQLIDKLQSKSVLVIGGAGSIGSSFIKAILPYRPSELTVVDINENALTELTRDLRSDGRLIMPDKYLSYPIDYASLIFKKLFFAHEGFDVVANFAAHKHVRSEKDMYSIEAMLQNNVLHVRELLELLSEYPPEEYFCVSTDKAANPVNIMGASKRIMEDLIFAYSDKFPVKTARFANVAFSNGSLPAGFLERIEKLQPVSAPSDVKRYFVSPQESGQICMLACLLGRNREIFFPKLNKEQMMTFDSIASNLLREQGYDVLLCESDKEAQEKAVALKDGSKKYPVHYGVSDTSGEKPFEEFYTESENVDMERFRTLGVITGKAPGNWKELDDLFINLETMFHEKSMSKEDIVAVLKEYLPEFKHVETGKSLDGKM